MFIPDHGVPRELFILGVIWLLDCWWIKVFFGRFFERKGEDDGFKRRV